MKLPVEVIQAVKENRCIVFVGTRTSMEAADQKNLVYPEAKDLAKDLGWKRPKMAMGAKSKHVIASVEEGCAAYEATHGRAALVKRLDETIGCAGVPPTSAHHALLRHFPLLFTTCQDDLLERAAKADGLTLDVIERGQKVPDVDPARRTLVKLRGSLDRPQTLVLTGEDFKARAFGPDVRKQLRAFIRGYVVFFVGFRPDEEEFDRLFDQLSDAYGGELPRCHMSVAQGAIDDYLWQKWVWRGLLMFTADPVECMQELEASL